MVYIRRKERYDPWWHIWGLTLGLLFALMLMIARLHASFFDGIDVSVESIVKPFQTYTYLRPWIAISVLGSSVGISVVAIGTAILLRRNLRSIFQLCILMAGTSVSMGAAKLFVERARPNVLLWLDPLNTYSFPSGHASLTTALYSFIAVCLWRRIPSRTVRYISTALCVGVIFLVCLSRIQLNYHYFTDVLAGVLLGLFWLAVTFMIPPTRK